jgi:hypothetical protein
MTFSFVSRLIFPIIVLSIGTGLPVYAQASFYVASDGSDQEGDGSEARPWESIPHALDNVVDGSTILVKPGEYTGRIRIRGTFLQGVTVRSEVFCRARLRHSGTVITAYSNGNGCEGITIEGFDIAHSGEGAEALVFHIDGGGDRSVRNITVRGNVLHDSYNNDILKINNSAVNIIVEGNMFYNQTGSDEHIDVNSVDSVYVRNNIFFNDFSGSGRSNENNTSSFIVIKDSNNDEDAFEGTRNVVVNRNVFFNWEGSTGSNFILIGEDGKPYHEAFLVCIENNLMLGNSGNVMRASFGVKGGRDIIFRNNTVSGDLPSLAYAMRLNSEGSNPANESIHFYNNIWCDPTGTMGATGEESGNDFSDTPPDETVSFILSNNLYWNGGEAIPEDNSEGVNFTDDEVAITENPLIKNPSSFTLPRWMPDEERFADGSATIRDVFVRVAAEFGVPGEGSPVIGGADAINSPSDDIFGNKRDDAPDIGCAEFGASGIDRPASGMVQRKNGFFCCYDVFSKKLIIKTAHKGIVVVSIYDSQGRLVDRFHLDLNGSIKGVKSMDGAVRGSGVYSVKIEADRMAVMQRICLIK